MVRQAILLAVAAGAAITVTAAGRPSFHIRLDGALDAEGGACPVKSTNISFVPGVRGERKGLTPWCGRQWRGE